MESTNRPFTTCLWFDNQAEQAMNFYTSIFKNSSIGSVARYGPGMPAPEGSVMTATFTLNGQKFMGLNGGPIFQFSEAVSLVINCEDQTEVDYYWDALLADGGKPSQCGWLKDKFGFSWQIIPVEFEQLAKTGTKEQVGRMMQAMMKMVKLDMPTLKKAFNGE